MPETRGGSWYRKRRRREGKGWVVPRWGLWMGIRGCGQESTRPWRCSEDRECRDTAAVPGDQSGSRGVKFWCDGELGAGKAALKSECLKYFSLPHSTLEVCTVN